MFSFELPRFAALQVTLPTGGEATLVHAGGGRFVSSIPPLLFVGVAPEEGVGARDLPVTWDAATLKGDGQGHVAAFAFDAVGAQKAVEDAAAAGDTFAQKILGQMAEAEKMLDAQKAVGMVPSA